MLFALLACLSAVAADAPEISRSAGEKGGVVVLWPRVIPATDDPAVLGQAAALQARLKAVVELEAPGVTVDLRPAPERVCPRAGCKAVAVGAVLHHREGGCVAVATVSDPGPSVAALVPWGGLVELKQPTTPFRDPPENALVVKDFAACADLGAATAPRDEAVRAAVRAALAR